MKVRRATLEDVPAIAAIHVSAWRAAYRGIVPQALLDSLSVEQRIVMWERIIGNPESPTTVWVADEDGTIGFASTGQPGADDAQAGTAELFTLYLEPDWIGKGAGAALMNAALAGLRERGFGAVILWVLEENSAARAFYERGGWQIDGGAKSDESGSQVRYRMRLV